MMEYVCKGAEPTHDDMYGVYASHEYCSGEAITVYVGKVIGAYDGEKDDYAGYREMERVSAPRADGSMGKRGEAYHGDRGGSGRWSRRIHRSAVH